MSSFYEREGKKMTGLEGALITAGSSFLKKPFEEMLSGATASVKSLLTSWGAAGAVDNLQQKIEDLEKIRTVASRQAATLSDIFYPPRLVQKGEKKNSLDLDVVAAGKNILLVGTAGQGKSVLLRYLAVQELRRGRKIPLFLELRRIDKNNNLDSILQQALFVNGVNENRAEVLAHLLSRGLVLFLDGFDEVSREFALGVRDKLSNIMSTYPKTKIVLSSRPGALSAHLVDLPRTVYMEIDEMVESDFEPFFTKIGTPKEVRENLISAVSSSSTQVRRLLKTPLLLTLLVMTCGRSQQIPDTLPEFYDSLFRVLAIMHDETKPGYVREAATGLGHYEIERLFECFCFVAVEKFDKTSLTISQFDDSHSVAAEITGIECTSEGFKTEVTETVCLMVKDGLDTTFLHKSIQEYYAARYLKNLTDEELKSFNKSLIGLRLFSWVQQLKFFEKLDPVKYGKFFKKPQSESFLAACGYRATSRKLVTRAALKKVVGIYGVHKIDGRLHLVFTFLGVENIIDSYIYIEIGNKLSEIVSRMKVDGANGEMIPLRRVCQGNPTGFDEIERLFTSRAKQALADIEALGKSEAARHDLLSALKTRRHKKT